MPGSQFGTGALGMIKNDEASFYQHDQIGTPNLLTSKTGQVKWQGAIDAFGQMVSTTSNVNSPLRFPGQYQDNETGYHQNYFRDYNSRTGRYLQSDPIGLNGGVNLYSYSLANPVSFYDPMGLLSGRDVVSFVPVVGSAMDSYDAFKCGNWGMGLLNAGLAVTELFGVGAIVKGLTVGTMKWANRKLIKEIFNNTNSWNAMRRTLQRHGIIPRNSMSTDRRNWLTTDHIGVKQRDNLPHSVTNHPRNLQINVPQSLNSQFESMDMLQRALYLPFWMKLGAAGTLAYLLGVPIDSGNESSCECG